MEFYEIGQLVCNGLLSAYFHVEITGTEHLPPQGTGFVLISNHQSYLDPVFLGLRLPGRRLTFMAKEELFHVPILAPIIKKLGAFPVDRNKRDGKAIAYAKEVVQSNRILALFPEGHRSLNGKLAKPKSGAVVIASQTKAPILPAAVYYAGKHPRATVRVHFGEPLSQEDLALPEQPTPREIKEATRTVWSRVEKIYEMEQEASR